VKEVQNAGLSHLSGAVGIVASVVSLGSGQTKPVAAPSIEGAWKSTDGKTLVLSGKSVDGKSDFRRMFTRLQ